ncbi:MAG: hypothetical protein QF918_00425 [Pirellulaceae bacterium]|nr:hypothetical protein [Pirellulaceae bacterium]
MPIRITCRHCGKSFSAWDDLIGKSVQCPKCQQSMTVQTADGAAPASSESSRGSAPTSVPSSRPQPTGKPRPAQSRPVKPQAVSPKPPAPPSPVQPPPVPKPPSATPPAKQMDTASSECTEDFDDREDLPFGCPNCNAEMEPDDDLCNACGYHLILKKVIDMEGVDRPDTSTGFDRVVKKHLNETDSTTNMLMWAKIVGFSFLFLVGFVCLGRWGLAIGVVFVVGYFIYGARLRIIAEDNPDAHIEREPIAAVTWSAMLSLQRMFGWRSLEPPFGVLRVLTLRNGSFTNDDLGQVEDLKQLQVLDLEGTGITDAGLSHLKGRKKLCFLVVKNTAVTAAGVERLQRSIPTAWIWY